jgi:hypothetical protein
LLYRFFYINLNLIFGTIVVGLNLILCYHIERRVKGGKLL